MTTSETIGRNDPCPCGSGQKYKVCCEGRQDIVQEAKKSPWLIGGAAVLGLGVVATIAMQLGDPKPSEVNRSFSAVPPSQSPMIDPATLLDPLATPGGPSTAPAGKVWSAEHGHYHDIAGNELPAGAQPGAATPMPMAAAPGTLTPQPDGPVPEGKVWSPEHGHWHDASAAAPVSSLPAGVTPTEAPAAGTLTPQPDGPVPEGKVWSPEHGHWHDAGGATPGAMPEIKIGGAAGGELIPIPPPAGAGATPPAPAPTPAPTPAEQTPPPPKPADAPVTPPK